MESKTTIKISVRTLVELMLQAGDLNSGYFSNNRAVDGIKAHQLLSKTSKEEYQPEVAVSYTLQDGEIELEINGRIDGVVKSSEGIIIDEIKTTTLPIEFINENFNSLHWAQAKCYAYIYGIQNSLVSLCVRLTYYQIDTCEIKYLTKTLDIKELESFFFELIEKYLERQRAVAQWNQIRDISIKALKFPFSSYRKGQRELASAVYRTVRDGNRFFVQAPTGIGKTIATLFPTIKAMGEGLTTKIFYLTAKTITRTIAENALQNMRNQGLKIKTITITAKDKICFKPESACIPDECEYCKGYYDRVNGAIDDAFKTESLTRQIIEELAERHNVCPFEFTLDLSLWCDCIICDYNYVFDPRVCLKRYFGVSSGEMIAQGEYTFLVDEAHNLVDRAREMFSAELYKRSVLELKRLTKEMLPKLSKSLDKINSFFISQRKECQGEEKDYLVEQEPPKELYSLLKSFVRLADTWLAKNEISNFKEKLLEFYFEALNFIRTFESFDERFVTYSEAKTDDFKIKIFCLDPSFLLQEAMKRGKSAILFSATLTPLDYFSQILGGGDNPYKLKLASPFPRENLCLIIENGISTRYKTRENTYDKIAKSLYTIACGKRGNYLIFFPSYKYMMDVYERFSLISGELRVMYQWPGMSEGERENFLQEFSEDGNKNLVAFAVMGGIFGEGIDLVGERLSGVVIVGVGLPQICLEREIIRKHFQEQQGMGFEYSYMYPGMNKVLQAVGRVIRTEEDRGVALLIDERFSYQGYTELYPQEWSNAKEVKNLAKLSQIIEKFWEGQ